MSGSATTTTEQEKSYPAKIDVEDLEALKVLLKLGRDLYFGKITLAEYNAKLLTAMNISEPELAPYLKIPQLSYIG